MNKADKQVRSVRIAKLLIEVLQEHVRDALAQNVPRAVYVRAVADHAAFVYDTCKDDPS